MHNVPQFFLFFKIGKVKTLVTLLSRGIPNASDIRIEEKEKLLQSKISKLKLTK